MFEVIYIWFELFAVNIYKEQFVVTWWYFLGITEKILQRNNLGKIIYSMICAKVYLFYFIQSVNISAVNI